MNIQLNSSKSAPKRAYSDDYLKLRCNSIVTDGIEKLQSVICLNLYLLSS